MLVQREAVEGRAGKESLTVDSQSDIKEINLGFRSGMPSYITDQWAPLPRTEQDVAGEEEWQEMGF